ncbi:MAG: RsmG family class I SAM-dependent methyltransferase, partial [Candidatus Bathyarchaeia archaeon]
MGAFVAHEKSKKTEMKSNRTRICAIIPEPLRICYGILKMRSLIEDGLRLFSIPYDKESLEKLVSFLEQLLRWSYRINLTGLKDPSLIVRRLLFDTFFLLSRFEGQSAVDMGSGSGVVAVPTSILKKEATVFSVDSTLKKIQV